MIETVLTRLLGFADPLMTLSKNRREKHDNALKAISHALNETCLYQASIARGKSRNLDVEEQLSRYWAAAAVPVRHLDKELAEICEHKSNYWVNPETWGPRKIKLIGMRLDEVRQRYMDLLTSRRSRDTFKRRVPRGQRTKK